MRPPLIQVNCPDDRLGVDRVARFVCSSLLSRAQEDKSQMDFSAAAPGSLTDKCLILLSLP
jgi:hypothetical protein